MTKQELIDAINEAATSRYDAGVSKVVIAAVLDTLGDVAQAEMQQGGEVTLPGLGKLSVKSRAARTGRNPATGEEMQIAAKNVPHFSAAKALKDAAMSN
ncbi:MAG: HU family DNA-binding protein [Comamonadaceae bacterium CG_4_9_14_0_8_um_filter_60_18]|nr:MAG: HU family DNA-binding protein [Comamonadaceae bacterium CG_4_9_14_0_8_um_filter_60_18]